jgi:hypothetical protein
MPEETITLREAARRLARIRRPKGKGIESSKLLNVLRSGELKAGYYIMGGALWIEIPLMYWQAISSDRFRRIGQNPDDPKSGTYKIRTSTTLVDQVADLICKAVEEHSPTKGHDAGAMRNAVTAVVNEAAKSYEVTVKATHFLEYLKNHGLEEKVASTNVGRKRKEGWRELCSYMAAYFAAYQRDRGRPPKIDQAQTDIIKIAKGDNVLDLPDETTIKDQISQAVGFLDRPEFKLRKPTAADIKSHSLPQKT